MRRDPIIAGAVALTVTAFAGSFTHVQHVVSTHGQHGWISYAIAAMPEVSVLLAVLKVRRARGTGEAVGWAWLVGVTSAVFTLSANLATAQHDVWGWVVAGWPAIASVGAAGMIHVADGAEPAPDEPQAPPMALPAPLLPVTTPTPAPEPEWAPEPARVPAAAETRRDTVSIVSDDVPTRRSRRTDQEWWDALDEAVRTGRLDADPDRVTADRIREALGCGLPRARAMRDQIRAERGAVR